MNPRAIDDLLSTVLSAFYRSAAAWTPPGRVSEGTCTNCSSSLLSELIDTWRWPHDLMHDLASSLTALVGQIAESSVDADRPRPPEPDDLALAAASVRRALAPYRIDILDVLIQCVEPRLDAYLRSESLRGLGEVAQWAQGHRG